MAMDNIRQGTYKVHEEHLNFFNGIAMKMTLSLKIEFVKSVTHIQSWQNHYRENDPLLQHNLHLELKYKMQEMDHDYKVK